jgi:RHH-type proline utilization regulon transcriptional repressor/proline dehydrogenase/delta 1-pyrroline-5-carboxylate dehydrogenase
VAAISPWNFPLAIFIGQVAAALAAGNPVLAKPAEQTPLIAAHAVRLLHEAGVPRGALQLLPGDGDVGAALVRDERVRGVLFTGSTEVAQAIDRTLAARCGTADPVLVAETGGQNAMIVDSSALPEQVVQDALQSAFDSAGQRCSALRVLCLQDEIAEPVIRMLAGAAEELRVGDPRELATDVGPVIDRPAAQAIEAHLARMPRARVRRLALPQGCAGGTFVAPAIVEIDSMETLRREVFGPVLHVLRFPRERLGELVDAINATGYGLTLGIQSRIDETIDFVVARARAGNVYVNRNMIGAVVGTQPFGGEGLSGTGPKAGGPFTLARLRRDASAASLDPSAFGARREAGAPPALIALEAWARAAGLADLAAACGAYARATPIGCRLELPGPTGESNTLSYRPRGRVLCVGDDAPALLAQIAAAVATANRALIGDREAARSAVEALPESVRLQVDFARDAAAGDFDLALLEGSDDEYRQLRGALAQRDGTRIRVLRPNGRRYPLHWMVVERVVTINTAAAGGNATLMTLDS